MVVTGKTPRVALVRNASSAPRSSSGRMRRSTSGMPAPARAAITFARVMPSRMPTSDRRRAPRAAARPRTRCCSPPRRRCRRRAQDRLVGAAAPAGLTQGEHVVQVVAGLHRRIDRARAVARDRHDRDRHALVEHLRRRRTERKRRSRPGGSRRGRGVEIELPDSPRVSMTRTRDSGLPAAAIVSAMARSISARGGTRSPIRLRRTLEPVQVIARGEQPPVHRCRWSRRRCRRRGNRGRTRRPLAASGECTAPSMWTRMDMGDKFGSPN